MSDEELRRTAADIRGSAKRGRRRCMSELETLVLAAVMAEQAHRAATRPELHRFRLPFPDGWRPATKEDAWALGHDLMSAGTAFATTDGRRVDPETVVLRDDIAYGGEVRLPDDLQA